MMGKGLFIVISGPSGVGKGTICEALMKNKNIDLEYSISMTTRNKRDYEKEGVHYYFTDKNSFERKIRNNEFVEYAIYNNEYYGTLKSEVLDKINLYVSGNEMLDKINNGKYIISEIEVQGAKKIKKDFPNSLLLYILPPSIEELRNRLIKRGTESKEEIERRLKISIIENKYSYYYDYVIVNDKLEVAVKEIEKIIKNKIIDNT